MANAEGESRRRRRRRASIGSETRRRGGDIELDGPTLQELRDIRNDLYVHGVRRTTDSAARMPSSTSKTTSGHKSSSSTHKHHSRQTDSEKSRHRRRATEGDTTEYVYASRNQERRDRRGRLEEEDDEEELSVIVEEPKITEKKIRVIYLEAEKPQRHSRKHDGKYESTSSLHRSSSRRSPTSQPLEVLKRTLSTREPPPKEKLSLKRGYTLSTTHASRDAYDASVSNAPSARRSTFMGIFAPGAPATKTPPRMVQCLTCMDDVPHPKSAKLKCSHRMCHSCLKRIFKLSVNDPQHMPPKCCTSEHIPLKHVERLFDTHFKILWNKKFQEYTTKNRIYCPARRCGEWIKPGNIHSEGGKKYGKCGRCKTKVCCRCSGKWHGSKDCPKDDETKLLLEAAKKAGWQRCYNCRSMVELKEGCNHMTCRCTAEFCMICGLKWKTCDCPWFNFEAVEADRLQHMAIPVAAPAPAPAPAARRAAPAPAPAAAAARARRHQEFLDEELARRINALHLDHVEDYNGPIGDVQGFGNLNHHMNETYRRPVPVPVPLARAAADYAVRVTADRHPRRAAPAVERRAPSSSVRRRVPASPPSREMRPAVLAGLEGPGRSGGRVSAWRSHVLPIEPSEGGLSM